MAAKTVVRTRTTRAAKSTETKAPQPMANRYRGVCAECNGWVNKEKGIVTPPSAKGEKWVTHHGHIADNGSAILGPCPKPATVNNRRSNKSKENTMPVRRRATKKAAPKKIETFERAEIAELSLVDLRKLAKELELDEQMKKAGILAELENKGHLVGDQDELDTPAPAKKTTPRKRTAKATESASASDDEAAEDDEVASALSQMLEAIREQINSGVLDAILGDIDDAITSRLEAVQKEDAAAKKSAAKKTTTPAKSRAEKLAPVTRAKKSASAPIEEPEESDGDTLAVGKIYNLKGKALGGARGKFMGYKDGDDTRAIVVLTKAHGDRPKGAKISISVRSIEH
ncbi:hypothetical protein GCM10010423_65630 [Streptomyces levis]|uniref:Rho termination factor N-terminal domain-containing protein n=1 Tax=Streptomyces levis TaxID=285566 RepID=A0ABP6BBT9_9ACTN